jgi:hypothetical protein
VQAQAQIHGIDDSFELHLHALRLDRAGAAGRCGGKQFRGYLGE